MGLPQNDPKTLAIIRRRRMIPQPAARRATGEDYTCVYPDGLGRIFCTFRQKLKTVLIFSEVYFSFF